MAKSGKLEGIVHQELVSICAYLEEGLLNHLGITKKVGALCLLYSIPNEGKRSMQEADRLKRQGLRSGIPDLCLPVRSKCGKYGSLYLEMKRESGGHVSANQHKMIENLRKYGNMVEVCRNAESGLKTIAEHLGRSDILQALDRWGISKFLVI
jgi:hypothetical protein